MSRYQHGGGIHQAAAELQRPVAELLDFSASINPLGMPETVRAAAAAALDEAIHYPEIHAESLLSALAAHHHLDPCHFLAGNGSTPLFTLFARTLRPRRALVVRPAFSEYQRALEIAGTEIEVFDLDPDKDFNLDPCQLLHQVTPATDLLLIANPGNPSGARIEATTILTLAHALREQAVVAVDEAFIDFCPDASVLQAVANTPNLYVFRSMTKFYAIPGLRVGYLAGPINGICRLREAAEPWALSTVAIAAAKAALQATTYSEETLQCIPQLRSELADGLRALGLHVYPSAANYLLLRLAAAHADEIVTALRAAGILLRSCSNFLPLDAHYLRVAVRTRDENQRLLSALARFFSPG
ncbi:MAG: threonine-phosphate decarboxylase [Desulfuromonadales bacterium]|nr:threonine-phosphate decarboxylase [Desulfuromonadales bacterium]